ncbi:MAG: hypothetical protein AVDCRST_MAG49-3329, partial [uncultured Thermomicrobiales bacterium]
GADFGVGRGVVGGLRRAVRPLPVRDARPRRRAGGNRPRVPAAGCFTSASPSEFPQAPLRRRPAQPAGPADPGDDRVVEDGRSPLVNSGEAPIGSPLARARRTAAHPEEGRRGRAHPGPAGRVCRRRGGPRPRRADPQPPRPAPPGRARHQGADAGERRRGLGLAGGPAGGGPRLPGGRRRGAAPPGARSRAGGRLRGPGRRDPAGGGGRRPHRGGASPVAPRQRRRPARPPRAVAGAAGPRGRRPA